MIREQLSNARVFVCVYSCYQLVFQKDKNKIQSK